MTAAWDSENVALLPKRNGVRTLSRKLESLVSAIRDTGPFWALALVVCTGAQSAIHPSGDLRASL